VIATAIQGCSACHQSAGGVDMWSQAAQELATGPRIVYMEHDVRAVVRLGARAEHRRLNFVEFDGDGSARKIDGRTITESHGALLIGVWIG
jgi:hypothetical protein